MRVLWVAAGKALPTASTMRYGTSVTVTGMPPVVFRSGKAFIRTGGAPVNAGSGRRKRTDRVRKMSGINPNSFLIAAARGSVPAALQLVTEHFICILRQQFEQGFIGRVF